MDNQVTCGCGKQGCWVTEIGASAVYRKLVAAGVDLPDGMESGVDWLEAACEKARHRDPVVLQVLDAVAQQVGQGLAKLVLTFNPSLLIVGGRMGELMKFAETGIREGLMKDVLPYMKEHLELVVSDTKDEQLKGCLATVFDFLMKNPDLK
jgi:predicted NBD/HSP70 family sugar kinase